MNNFQNFNIKEFFNLAGWNAIDATLQNVNKGLTEKDKKAQSLISNLSVSLSGLDTISNLVNSNIQNTSSSLALFNTGFSILNANLLNSVRLFNQITEGTGKSRAMAGALKENLANNINVGGSGAGTNGTGDPLGDPETYDDELKDLISLKKRVTTLKYAMREKGFVNSLTTGFSIRNPFLSLGLTGVSGVNAVLNNQLLIEKNLWNKKTGEFISDELLKANVDKNKISEINWRNLPEIDWGDTSSGALLSILGMKIPKFDNASKVNDTHSGITGVYNDYRASTVLSQIEDDVDEKITQRKKQIEWNIKNLVGTIDILPVEVINKVTDEEMKELMKKDPAKKVDRPKKIPEANEEEYYNIFNRDRGVGAGQKSSQNNNKNFGLSAEHTISDRGSGANKTEKPKGPTPFETFVGVFGQVQKVGGALNTIMNNLHIGANTFVGGLINGFNNALGIIQSIVEVIQALQTIGSILKLPFFAEGGHVQGVGDTDSVPAMLTPGEFVVRKSVVNKIGSGFFEWMNGGGLTNSLAGMNELEDGKYFALAA